jgi:uncharacterized protein with HEPN domain
MSENRKSVLPYVKDILDSINKIENFTIAMTYEEFLKDVKSQDAVIRNLEVIGEAVKNVSDGIKKKFKDIPWKSIASMRDKLIHEYWGVSFSIVWETIKSDFPLFKVKIENLYEELIEVEGDFKTSGSSPKQSPS